MASYRTGIAWLRFDVMERLTWRVSHPDAKLHADGRVTLSRFEEALKASWGAKTITFHFARETFKGKKRLVVRVNGDPYIALYQ